jgi:HK97 family phage major capsid protein
MKTKTETKKTPRLFRHAQFDRAAVNEDQRTVSLAFSSETPYERFFGTEVLDHASKSVRLGRLTDGGAVLLDHDLTRHVGVVEEVSIGRDRVGRAVVRFGRSSAAEEAFRDVVDGIRRHVSVGYLVHRMEEDRDTETFRVTDWEPIELSLVAVPADPTVGIGRAAEDTEVSTTIVRHVADEDPPAPVAEDPPVATIRGVRTMTTEPKTKEPADIERDRVSEIVTLGEQYARWVTQKEIGAAIRSGHSPEIFKNVILANMETRHTDTSALHIGMERREVQRYSFARALHAAVTQDWSKAGLERSASEAVAKMVGGAPEGFFVPLDIFRRDFNVGTGSESGNLVATDLRGDLYVDSLRNAMVMAGLGIRILPGLTGNIDMPRKSAISTIGTLAEIGSAAETNPQTAKVTLSPKRLGAFVEVSKQAIIQSSLALEGMIRDDLLTGAAVIAENLAINGVGSSNQPLGLRNTASIGTVAAGANGATVAWSHLVGLESACANANAEPDRLAGYLLNTRTRGAAKQVQRGTNLPFIWENGAFPVNGYRAAVSNNVPSNLTKGTNTTVCSAGLFASDWSMAVLGFFGAPDIVVDPYTKADTGQVKITLNQFFDFGVRQPGAFAKIEDLLT